MNFNASRNVGQTGGPRKAKRVSHVAAMGAPPATSQAYPPAPMYDQGYPSTSTPPSYQQGIQLDNNITYGSPAASGNFNYMGFPQSPLASPVQMMQQPIVQDMALQYGNHLAAQGREVVQKYVPVSRLRYYFAVDTRYVMKKLLLILFPYTHKDWMVKYDQDSPVQPRYDVNAPDLYIPSMGYVTYVLLAGFMLGLQHRFSPEQISIQSSSALAYILFEILLYIVTLYITNTNTNLKTLDLLAFSGYKYIAMIVSLLAGLVFGRTGYYSCLIYTSFALSYFLVQTLKLHLLSGFVTPEQEYSYQQNPYTDNWAKPTSSGTKRRVYFLVFVALTQPLLSCWLTYHLVPSANTVPPPVSAV